MLDKIKSMMPYPVRRTLRLIKRHTKSLYTALPGPLRQQLNKSWEINCIRRQALLERRLKKKFGSELITLIDERDEMFIWLNYSSRNRAEAVTTYLRQGEEMVEDLEEVLMDAGRTLDSVSSLLDFACGYGRCVRFLVQRLGRDRVSVSDISEEAVDFNRRMFGVAGFVSVTKADALDHDGKYDVIFVASLFSHLPVGDWSVWLRRLGEMLTSGGVLVFSTHGSYCYKKLDSSQVSEPEPGFYFAAVNETDGRLATEQYGSTYVTEDYVRRTVAANSSLRLVGFHPHKLVNFQDIYVVERLRATEA